jgi:putative membrane protein
MYYTFKQVLADPETRGTILIPLGILLLIYPIAVFAELLGLPGSSLGLISALLGLYVLFRGLGLEETIDGALERVRVGLFSGRVQLITYVVAAALVAVGSVGGLEAAETLAGANPEPIRPAAAFVYGAVQWIAAAGVVAALGRITDEYLADGFRWRYLNAPFYVVAIAIVLHGLSAFFVELPFAGLSYLAVTLTTGTFLGLASTLAFAVAEQRYPTNGDSEIAG